MAKKHYNIAVIGASGSVGQEVLNILSERNFPISNIYAVASTNSMGKAVSFGDRILKITTIDNLVLNTIDIAFFCTSSEIAKQYIPQFVKAGCICIDKSSAYRMDAEVPLMVPEANRGNIKIHKNIIASPNCCAIPLAVVLKPLDMISKIKRVVISTYQSVSGAGKDAMDELYNQTKSKYVFGSVNPKVFPKQIAFNILPQIGEFDKNGISGEEAKITEEINKILGDHIRTSVTSVRVPVFVGHSLSVNIEFQDDMNAKEAGRILKKQQSINIPGTTSSMQYLTPIEVIGEDYIHVSRIRDDNSQKNTINLWVVCDNLRKGAALNAVQIAELLL